MSHVLEHVLFSDLKQIELIRANIFSHMMRIAKKSVILISDQLFIGHKSMTENLVFIGHKRIALQSNISNFIPSNYRINFLKGDNESNIFILKIDDF